MDIAAEGTPGWWEAIMPYCSKRQVDIFLVLAPCCLAADNPSAAAIGSELLRHCQYCPDHDRICTIIPKPQRMHCKAACHFWAKNSDKELLKHDALPAFRMHWTSWINSLLSSLQEHVLCTIFCAVLSILLLQSLL